MKKSLWFFLLVTPIFYSGLLDVKDIREQQFWIVLIAAAFFVGVTHFNKIIGIGILYCLAHLALFQRPAYVNNMAQILAHAIVYDCVARHYTGKDYKWPLLAVLVLNLIMAALQFFKQDVFLQLSIFTDQTPGLMTLPVYVGIYAAITAPVIFTIHPALIILSIFGIIISKSSFAALAFACGMGFYLFRTNRKLFKAAAAGGLVLLFLFIRFYDGPTGQFSRRIHIWKMAGSILAVNPFGGWGLGSYHNYIRFVEIGNKEESREYVAYQPAKPKNQTQEEWLGSMNNFGQKIELVALKEFGPEKAAELQKIEGLDKTVEWFRKNGSDFYFWQDPHNQYLLAWFEGGLPLLLIILWYLWDMGKRFQLLISKIGKSEVVTKLGREYYVKWLPDFFSEQIALFCSFIALAIISFAHFPFGVARISFTAVCLLAILDSRLKPHERE